MFMPAGFAEFLAQKYRILQQEADANTARAAAAVTAANAGAALDRARTDVIPAESAAGIGLTKAQAGLATANVGLVGSQARKIDEETKVVAPLARASIRNSDAQARGYNAEATGTEQRNKLTSISFGGLRAPTIDDVVRGRTFGFGFLGN